MKALAFLTRTATVSETTGNERAIPAAARELEVLGYDSQEQNIYLLEHIRDNRGTEPQLYVMDGHRWVKGHTTHVHDVRASHVGAYRMGSREQHNALRQRLTPLFPVGDKYFRMNTRVVKRSAVRVERGAMPVRKFDLRVTIRPMAQGKVVPMGARKTVTAYLRPNVRISEIWAHPGLEFAVAVVSYVGIPYELGYDKQTAIFVPLQPHFYPRTEAPAL